MSVLLEDNSILDKKPILTITLHDASNSKELAINFRKLCGVHTPVYINVFNCRWSWAFLRVNTTNNFSYSNRIGIKAKNAQQCLCFLRRLRKLGMFPMPFTNFYWCTAESILSGCITVWYSIYSAQSCKTFQGVLTEPIQHLNHNLSSFSISFRWRLFELAS